MKSEATILYGNIPGLWRGIVVVPRGLAERFAEVNGRLGWEDVRSLKAMIEHKRRNDQGQPLTLGVNDIRRFVRYHEKRMGIFQERARVHKK